MQTVYEPKGKAREYAPLALNLYESCPHGCRYCYAASMALRFGRAKDKAEWHGRLPADRVTPEAVDRYIGDHHDELTGRNVLLCFTCDPYPPKAYAMTTRDVLCVLRDHGVIPIILTKGGTRACRDFDILKAAGGWFGQTMGLWGADRKKWEAGAASLQDRTNALLAANGCRLNTWLSIEPIVDAVTALGQLRGLAGRGKISDFAISHLKLGKLNGYDAETRAIEKAIDWPAYRDKACGILDAAGYTRITEPGVFEVGTYYVKKELAET